MEADMGTQELPTMERVKHPELAALGREYRKKVDERLRALREEIPLKEKLIDMMHELGLERYDDDDIVIELRTTEKVKVDFDGGSEDDDC